MLLTTVWLRECVSLSLWVHGVGPASRRLNVGSVESDSVVRWTLRVCQGADVLHLTHMETIGVRELQQHASAALRRVARGETIGVTDRGRLVAVLSAPSTASGASALVASNRVQRARRGPTELPEPVRALRPTSEVLEELRDER